MTDNGPTTGKGKPFFDRADQVAETGNWDYAIEMYLQGIAREPEAMERGHHKLREVALMRKAAGGKPAGMLERRKHRANKDPITNLVNAEWNMSRDPDNAAAWKLIVSAAQYGKWIEVLDWAGGVLFGVNRMGDKRKDVYLFLTDVYDQAELYSDAVRACQMAMQADPKDTALSDRMRDLSAKETIQKGQYDQEGDFTRSVKDLDGQMELARGDQVGQDAGFLVRQIDRAREAYQAEPTVTGKINAFVDALTRTDDESYEFEAIDVLTKAHGETGSYRFKVRIGDIKIRQMNRRFNKLRKAGDLDAAKAVARELLEFELAEYAERATNYPTDLAIKYELGRRQFVAGKYDDAIATLQQARRDPKRRISAMGVLGQAFFKKGWHTEAAETFAQALEGDLTEGRRKELMYNLGLVLETQGKAAEAMEQYSDVAQIDFNYKDVRERIAKLRAHTDRPDDASSAG